MSGDSSETAAPKNPTAGQATAPAGQNPPDPRVPVSFETVFEQELAFIQKSREARGVTVEADMSNLTGLAFSGGGIRSATFNLGILQALAKQGLLSKFDYLSTVSGGGYIGSWLAAFTQRYPQTQTPPKFAPIQQALGEHTYTIGHSAEEPSIHWLRNYVDYLTPQTGAFSGDTGAMLGTWLRNVILNQIIVILFLLGATILPQVVVLFTHDDVFEHYEIAFSIGVVLLVVATSFMGVSMVDFTPWEEHRKQSWFRRNKVPLGVILPYFVAAWLINAGMWAWKDITQNSRLLWWMAGGAGFYTTIWIATFFWARKKLAAAAPPRELLSWFWVWFSAVGAGGLGGLLFYYYARFMATIAENEIVSYNWMVVIFGTVAFMLLMQFVAVIQLGLLGPDCLDLVREWWARAGGRLIQLMLTWVTIFGIVVFGPLGVRLLLSRNLKGAIGALTAWALSNWGGVLAAKSPKTGGEIKSTPAVMKAVSESKSAAWFRSPAVLEFVAKVAPYVFALGLLILLSTAVHILTGLYLGDAVARQSTRELWSTLKMPSCDIWQLYWMVQSGGQWSCLFLLAAILIAAATLLSWRVDINDFSLHHFYRNRLVRSYLGASRIKKRKPQPFTGFDPDDDIPLRDLGNDYPGPYPILNAALNVTSGGELGFLERKAKSFIFTPKYCGYDLAAKLVATPGAPADGSYLPTEFGRCKKLGSETKGVSLGTAMAISGAAASPNMGHYTSPASAFFMTLFDVRLGWWMGNPRHPDPWESRGPNPALAYLIKELVAQSDEASNYIYLSDGGHFENLGMYELVKRRCRLIMVCDGSADRGYLCGDLMGAIQKCRADFGVDIKINVSEIKPGKDQCASIRNFAIGEIRYGPADGDRGTLIYVKSSLPTDDANAPLESRLAAGVRSYADAHADFPHQSTADQWFDEVQFEAYRALGEYIGAVAGPYIRDNIAARWQ